jgi:hypothetical protein
MRSTENWSDVRYRAYTRSLSKADQFKRRVPKIQFTDSGHGIVPVVTEVTGRREPVIRLVAKHVEDALLKASKS